MSSASAAVPRQVLRSRTDNALPDAVRRLKAAPGIWMLLVAALAGLGAVVSAGHALYRAALLASVAIILALGIAAFTLWFWLTVLGSRWLLFSDRLVVQRPGAPRLETPLDDLGEVRIESISGFGLPEPILKFIDIQGCLIFWTVASRWRDRDLSELWTSLRRQPVDAVDTVNDFQTMPYDRRY